MSISTKPTRRAWLIGCTAFFVVALPTVAAAQPTPTPVKGFALDRYDPPVRGSDWSVMESLDLRGTLRPSLGLVFDFANKPLNLVDSSGHVAGQYIKDQIYLHVGGSILMWNRLRLAFNLPILVSQSSTAQTVDGINYPAPSSAGVGDLRLNLDLRIAGQYGGPATVAIGGVLYTPTGSAERFTGDGTTRGGGRAVVAGDVSIFTYAVQTGFIARKGEFFNNQVAGSEWQFGAAAGLRFWNKRILIGPEFYGAVPLDPAANHQNRQSPLELLGTLRWKFLPSWQVGVSAGPGFNQGFGSPEVRVLASIDWLRRYKEPPPPPPPDRDHDGVPDPVDACPDIPGVPTLDPKTNGCPPPPADKEGDGVPDKEDACPDVPGIKTNDPKTNGCPPPPADKDGDGVPDKDDACPDVPGVKTDDPKTNGCPADRDKDGIPDNEDACPDQPGPKNADPKKNGCPLAVVVNKEIKISEQVKFKTGSAEIIGSDELLNAVAKILLEHPELEKIRIEGHTDNQGGKAYNQRLSQRRAASVVAWLVKAGVAAKRMHAKGFGPDKPIDDNKTDAGRTNNRRVEFHIEKGAP
jgi:outer membrane protein OmpA-like peptidoglycan-associated protein